MSGRPHQAVHTLREEDDRDVGDGERQIDGVEESADPGSADLRQGRQRADGDHERQDGLRSQAPGAHTAVNNCANSVNALENELAAAQAAQHTAEVDHAASVTALGAAALTPAAPVAAANEARSAATLSAAVANTARVAGELAAAWTAYHTAMTVWNGLRTSAQGVHTAMQTASSAAKSIIDGQKDTPFVKNPTGLARMFKSVGDWLDEHADVLKLISDVLVKVGSIVAMLPGLGTLVGGIMIGIGLGIQLLLTLNGNMGWGEFAMSAVTSLPGGKALKAGAMAEKGLAKAGAKELAEGAEKKAARESSDCVKAGHPVDIATGAMVDDWTDVTIGGVLPLVVRREYSSIYGAGRRFGVRWCSVLDMRVEVDEESVTFVGDEGQIVIYPHPVDGEEVFAELSMMPLSFVDGAYRIRNVPGGVTYEFAMTGERGAVTVAASEGVGAEAVSGDSYRSPAAGSSLAGVLGVACVGGCHVDCASHRSSH